MTKMLIALCIIEEAIIAVLVYACKKLWNWLIDASADIEPIEWEDWADDR